MIRLTRLNHVPLVLNSDLIEHVEVTPDTVITLTTGQKLMVLESAEEVTDRVIAFASSAEQNGFDVIIAVAGMAAHLPGVIAAKTVLPVIGVPLPTSEIRGVDSLLAIVQMPGGIPVATMAIGKAGVKNAALLAVEILARNDEALLEKLREYRKNLV